MRPEMQSHVASGLCSVPNRLICDTVCRRNEAKVVVEWISWLEHRFRSWERHTVLFKTFD